VVRLMHLVMLYIPGLSCAWLWYFYEQEWSST
jgi:hypothetical protein